MTTTGRAETGAEQGADQRPGRGRPPRYRRDELLERVVEVFNERGYEATSMEDLARATGLNKSSFYHHFSGKEELLGLGVGRALDALAAVLAEPAARHGAAADRLEHVVRRTAEVLLAELPYVTLLLRVRGNTKVEREALRRRRDLDTQVAAMVRAAAEAGEIRPDVDPRLATRLMFGMVNSITEWYRPGVRPSSRTDVVNAVVAIAMHGLAVKG
ncbi:TetR family transcriptional regulator [Dactylosporangium aurantiacum]|uniref:TetR family transcriptional regulator n=1 Tax=Dactylosporangium aurantiacum TaxID=35754 RepID=A0A9Q9MIY0_9ACTN|nr:TetR/AcrR family transcriptional regulator [Dactylosporangium aurantiacum]MDG6110005.1 TetR/AcrR family transcriptional regulator [Dactylosporangium aurantiacum]UWZ58404.1 TetR family transcriptional regulator [Dactylosporangium aurantiacum]